MQCKNRYGAYMLFALVKMKEEEGNKKQNENRKKQITLDEVMNNGIM